MISILIVVSWNGHHPSYCAEIIRAIDSLSRRIYVICPNGANPLERVGGPASMAGKISVVFHTNRAYRTGFRKFADLAADFRELRAHLSAIRDANPGEKMFIFHTCLDSLFIGMLHLPLLWFCIPYFLPWPFSGLLLAPERRWPLSRARQELDRRMGEASNRDWFRRTAHWLLSGLLDGVASGLRFYYLWQKNQVLKRSRCEQIALQDERYADWLRMATGKNVVLYPETTSVQVSNPPPNLVDRIAMMKPGSVVVGLLGELSRRKGLDLLLEVIQNHNTAGLSFVIAGMCDPATLSAQHRAFLENEIHERNNVIFDPKSISSESDFNAIIECCDLLYCVYQNHFHSSNVISKAVAFRKPVLVNRGELMAKRVEEYRIGSILTDRSPDACLRALRCMGSPEYLKTIQETARYDQYMNDHSLASLQRTMVMLRSVAI